MPGTPIDQGRIPQPPVILSPSPPNPHNRGSSELMQTSPLTYALSETNTPSERSGRPTTKAPPLRPLSPAATEDRVLAGSTRSPVISSGRRPLMERELTGYSSARGQTNSLSSSPSHYADSVGVSQPIPAPRQMLSVRAHNSQMGGFHSSRLHTPGGLLTQATPRQHSDPNAASFNAGNSKPRLLAFQLGRVVGCGGFGVVYQAILSDGTVAAVKEMKLDTSNTRAIDREVEVMSSLPPHPHCVQYFGSRHSRHHYYIIMEYISAGSIQSLRQQIGPFRESVFQRYAFMILLGLDHLHQHHIIHRDIKGANVLLDERGSPKIVDFGCCKNLNQLNSTLGGGGTPLWMAPEVCRGCTANEKTDVWSFGCLCLEMTNSTGLPWNFPADTTVQGLAYAIACATQPPPIPDNLSAEAHNFIECCLQIDPDARLSVMDLLEHPFFDMDYLQNSEDDSELIASRGGSLIKSTIQNRRRGSEDGDTDVMNSVALNLRVVNASESSSESSVNEVLVYGRMDEPSPGAVAVSSTTASKSPSAPQLNHYDAAARRPSSSLQLHTNLDTPAKGHALSSQSGSMAAAARDEPTFRLANLDTGSDTDQDGERGGQQGGWVSSVSPSLARPSSVDGPATHDTPAESQTPAMAADSDADADADDDDQLVERLVALACRSGDRTFRNGPREADQHRKLLLGTLAHRPSLSSGDTDKTSGGPKERRSPATSSSFDTETSMLIQVPTAVVQRSRRCSRDSDSDSSEEPDAPPTDGGTETHQQPQLQRPPRPHSGPALRATTANGSRPAAGKSTCVAREDARRLSDLVADVFRNGPLSSAFRKPEVSAANYSSTSPVPAPTATVRPPTWLLRSGEEPAHSGTTTPTSATSSTISGPGGRTTTGARGGLSGTSLNGRGSVHAPSFPPQSGVSGKEAAPPRARVMSSNPVVSSHATSCVSTTVSPSEIDVDFHGGPIQMVPSSSQKFSEDDALSSAQQPSGEDGMVWLTGGADRVAKTSAPRYSSKPATKPSGSYERSASRSLSILANSSFAVETLSSQEVQEAMHRTARNEKKRSGVMAKLLRKS